MESWSDGFPITVRGLGFRRGVVGGGTERGVEFWRMWPFEEGGGIREGGGMSGE